MSVLDEETPRQRVQLARPPATAEELWWVVKTLWGVSIPRVNVCPDHVSPFHAFCDGYFGNESNICLWYGSRGTGKSLMLALLALTKAALLEINVTLLGGSMAQSANVQEHIENLLLFPGAPTWAVAQQIQTQLTFTGGNWIRPLPASQKTVRGPHPQMTCLHEKTRVNLSDPVDGKAAYRYISDLRVGDSIYGFVTEGNPAIGPYGGWRRGSRVRSRVLAVMDQGVKPTVSLKFAAVVGYHRTRSKRLRIYRDSDDTRLIRCTADHRFWTLHRGWVEAQDLTSQDIVEGSGGFHGLDVASAWVLTVREARKDAPVWDITTTTGNFFANDVLVHNCLDEIDEMDLKVYNAAMGQAMAKPNARGVLVPEMVVASSTWQNPIGTFQHVRDEFLRKGLPVHSWCFRETLATAENPDGWMDPGFIERKKQSVPAEMFRVEYELGEPAGGSRAFDLEKLNKAFVHMEPVAERHAGSDDEWVFEQPVSTGWYAVGADWAKEEDKTVFVVFRMDESVKRCVYVRIVNRRPWPEMAEMFNEVMRRYVNVVAAHDGTGIGNVVNDLIDERAVKFLMVGRQRSEMLVRYISAVEQGQYVLPANTPVFAAHKATTVEDVYAPGKWNGHLPDEVAAFALGHHAVLRGSPATPPVGVVKTEYRPRATKELYPQDQDPWLSGDVRVSGGSHDGVWADFIV